jgi:hypothetical protein
VSVLHCFGADKRNGSLFPEGVRALFKCDRLHRDGTSVCRRVKRGTPSPQPGSFRKREGKFTVSEVVTIQGAVVETVRSRNAGRTPGL